VVNAFGLRSFILPLHWVIGDIVLLSFVPRFCHLWVEAELVWGRIGRGEPSLLLFWISSLVTRSITASGPSISCYHCILLVFPPYLISLIGSLFLGLTGRGGRTCGLGHHFGKQNQQFLIWSLRESSSTTRHLISTLRYDLKVISLSMIYPFV